MNLLTNDIEHLLIKSKYLYIYEYEDFQLNKLFNYWSFFEQKEIKIKELTNVSLDVILYSKYYWCTRYREKYMELYGQDTGIDQQQYKIIEELEQRLNNDIDWNLIQIIEDGCM